MPRRSVRPESGYLCRHVGGETRVGTPVMDLPEARVVVSPELTADELFRFYERNNICEVGFGKEVAARILDHPHVIVAAFAGDELIGLARATFDGLSAAVMELSLDVRWQGRGPDANGRSWRAILSASVLSSVMRCSPSWSGLARRS